MKVNKYQLIKDFCKKCNKPITKYKSPFNINNFCSLKCSTDFNKHFLQKARSIVKNTKRKCIVEGCDLFIYSLFNACNKHRYHCEIYRIQHRVFAQLERLKKSAHITEKVKWPKELYLTMMVLRMCVIKFNLWRL